jgi:hypothetical protein
LSNLETGEACHCEERSDAGAPGDRQEERVRIRYDER